MYPLQRNLNQISLQIDETTLQNGATGLSVNLAEFGGLLASPTGVKIAVDNVTIQLGADGAVNANYQVMNPL